MAGDGDRKLRCPPIAEALSPRHLSTVCQCAESNQPVGVDGPDGRRSDVPQLPLRLDHADSITSH